MGNPPPGKLPYTAPRLVVYGNLQLLTQNLTKKGADGSTGTSQKST